MPFTHFFISEASKVRNCVIHKCLENNYKNKRFAEAALYHVLLSIICLYQQLLSEKRVVLFCPDPDMRELALLFPDPCVRMCELREREILGFVLLEICLCS